MVDRVEVGLERFARELQVAVSLAEIREIYFDSVAEIVPADGVGYYRFLADPISVPVEKEATLSEQFIDDYEMHGRADDPVLDFVLEHRLAVDSSRLSPRRWEGSGARAVLAAEGLGHSLEAPLTDSGLVIGTINLARASDSDRFRKKDLTSARYIAEHLSLAMERARRYESLGQRASLLEGALEHSPHGVLINGLDGGRLFVNRRVQELFSQCSQHAGSQLPELVADVIEEFIAEKRHVATVNVRDAATGQRVIVKSHKVFQHESVVSLVYEYPDEEETTLPAWDVLSPREQEIATMVSQGLTTRQIAAKAFVSDNTVKQHLKRIFTKTDVHSRAELVQLIWSARQQSASELGRRG